MRRSPSHSRISSACRPIRTYKVIQGPELRTIFFGFDMHREELLYSNVKEEPVQDIRVRKAFYQAIDIEAIKRSVMRGSRGRRCRDVAVPDRAPKDLNTRLPFDPEASKKLLADAGYPNGFSVGLSCPTTAMSTTRTSALRCSMLARSASRSSRRSSRPQNGRSG